MNKEFSNIIIFNNNDILFIKEKLEKIFIDLDYTICSKNEAKHKVDIIHDSMNNICVVASKFFEFVDSDTDKSVIRKIAKRVAQDTFMVTSKKDFAMIEKYSFNKRTYDFIAFGDREKLENLGYIGAYEECMHKEIWKNHFVGRNTIKDVDRIISEKNTFFENYEIVIEILKLYGIKKELATYNFDIESFGHDILKEVIYFK